MYCTVPDHHVGLGLGREGVEGGHQGLDLVRHAVQLARGRLYGRDTLLEIGNANGLGIFLQVNKSIITSVYSTGCPVKLFRLGYLLFSLLLLIQIAKVGRFF